jgi:hypothetical protein
MLHGKYQEVASLQVVKLDSQKEAPMHSSQNNMVNTVIRKVSKSQQQNSEFGPAFFVFKRARSRGQPRIDQCGGLIGKASISIRCNDDQHFLCGGKLELPSHLRT